MSLVSSMNPPWVIQKYFVQDEGEARPISAHMMATGTVVLATDPVVEQLRQTAISLIGSSPTLTPQKLTLARYAAATKLEDAMDIVERNPAAANMLVSEAVRQMLQFAFLKAGRFIPRDKDILDALTNMDSDLRARRSCFSRAGIGQDVCIWLPNSPTAFCRSEAFSNGIASLRTCLRPQDNGKRK